VIRNRAVRGPDFLEALNWELDRYSGLKDLPDDVSSVMLEFFGRTSGEGA
jgi:hypothetical protein